MDVSLRRLLVGLLVPIVSACSADVIDPTMGAPADGHSSADDGSASQNASAPEAHIAMSTAAAISIPDFAVCSDADIAAIAAATNRAEIGLAELALKRAASPDVIAFATRTIAERTELLTSLNRVAGIAGILPMETGFSRQILEEAVLTRNALVQLKGAEFERAYINHEVLVHIGSLGQFDHVLIPGARDASVRRAMLDARGVVFDRLAHVVRVQTVTQGACAARAQLAE